MRSVLVVLATLMIAMGAWAGEPSAGTRGGSGGGVTDDGNGSRLEMDSNNNEPTPTSDQGTWALWWEYDPTDPNDTYLYSVDANSLAAGSSYAKSKVYGEKVYSTAVHIGSKDSSLSVPSAWILHPPTGAFLLDDTNAYESFEAVPEGKVIYPKQFTVLVTSAMTTASGEDCSVYWHSNSSEYDTADWSSSRYGCEAGVAGTCSTAASNTLVPLFHLGQADAGAADPAEIKGEYGSYEFADGEGRAVDFFRIIVDDRNECDGATGVNPVAAGTICVDGADCADSGGVCTHGSNCTSFLGSRAVLEFEVLDERR